MLKTVSNGQSIHQYIPPHLRRMFYNNPAAVHASQGGKDPYGFSTNGLVLYLPLWALKNNTTFRSVDANRMTTTVNGATNIWTPNGRNFTPGTPDYLEIAAAYTQLDFTSEDFSIIARIKIDDLTSTQRIIIRGLRDNDGYELYIQATGSVRFITNQATAFQYTDSFTGQVTTTAYYTVGISRSGTSVIPFIDGVNKRDIAGTHTNPLTSTRSAKVGIADNLIDNPFDGKIQFVMAYNRALSAGEHLDIHNRSSWRV